MNSAHTGMDEAAFEKAIDDYNSALQGFGLSFGLSFELLS